MTRKLANEELNRLSIKEFRQAAKFPVVLILDNVRSLHNVGSIFRTADAFLIEEIILCGLTGTPPNKEIEKTALGATQTVSWQHAESAMTVIAQLREKNYKIWAIEQAENSRPLNALNYDGAKTALVFGNEVYGVEQEVINVCDGVIEIPQAGSKHSLNIAVSVGLVLWQMLGNKL